MSIHENLLGGPPPTHLPDEPGPRELLAGGAAAADVAARYPTSSLAWAQLADDAFEKGNVIESYAYARTGYHRGRRPPPPPPGGGPPPPAPGPPPPPPHQPPPH
ncbi:DUF3151 family protein, partial [Streptomyces xantholiticus]